MKCLTTVLAVFLLAASVAVAQSSPGESRGEKGGDAEKVYEPYEESEFPVWLRELRRAEIVFIGSFPITMLVSGLSYDGYRVVRGSILGTAGGGDAGSHTQEERRGILVAGLSLSAVVAILDFVLGKLE